MMDLSNENRLILCCARARISEATLNRAKELLRTELNWAEILTSASRKGVAPLLYHTLSRIQEGELIPHYVIKQLRKAYHLNIAQNMCAYSRLRSLVEAFRQKEIEIIILKGAALAETVYGDIGLRSFSDIDLLVRKDELEVADAIMAELEYVPIKKCMEKNWFKKNHFHLPPFVDKDRSVIIELHWNIANRITRSIDIDEWWKRAKETEIEGMKVLVPSAEDMLIHLCVHLFNNDFAPMSLRNFCDIRETLGRYGEAIDWKRLKSDIETYGMEKPVYALLYLVKKLQMSENNSLAWLEPDLVDPKFLQIIEKRILAENDTYASVLSGGHFFEFYEANNLWNEAKVIFQKIFPGRDLMSARYSIPRSSGRIYFYYLVRPFALFPRCWRSVLQNLWLKRRTTA